MAPLHTIARVAGGFVPGPESPAEAQYSWRLRIGMSVACLFIAVAGFVCMSFGAIPGVFPGFARNDAVQTLATVTLSQQLLQLRKDQCKAANADSKALYFRLMMDSVEQYIMLTGKPWPVPPCEQVT